MSRLIVIQESELKEVIEGLMEGVLERFLSDLKNEKLITSQQKAKDLKGEANMQLNSNVLLTTKEAAKLLNISIPTITRWRKEEKIPFIQINGSIRYKSEDLKAMLNQ